MTRFRLEHLRESRRYSELLNLARYGGDYQHELAALIGLKRYGDCVDAAVKEGKSGALRTAVWKNVLADLPLVDVVDNDSSDFVKRSKPAVETAAVSASASDDASGANRPRSLSRSRAVLACAAVLGCHMLAGYVSRVRHGRKAEYKETRCVEAGIQQLVNRFASTSRAGDNGDSPSPSPKLFTRSRPKRQSHLSHSPAPPSLRSPSPSHDSPHHHIHLTQQTAR